MKQSIKEFKSDISDALMIKDFAIATLLIALIIFNEWCEFKNIFQALFSVTAWWMVIIGLLNTLNTGTVNKILRKFEKTINQKQDEKSTDTDNQSEQC